VYNSNANNSAGLIAYRSLEVSISLLPNPKALYEPYDWQLSS
jgi:hypothetical protein